MQVSMKLKPISLGLSLGILGIIISIVALASSPMPLTEPGFWNTVLYVVIKFVQAFVFGLLVALFYNCFSGCCKKCSACGCKNCQCGAAASCDPNAPVDPNKKGGCCG